MKIEDGEIVDDEPAKDGANKDFSVEESVEVVDANQSERKPLIWSRRDGDQRPPKMVKKFEIFIELLFSVTEFCICVNCNGVMLFCGKIEFFVVLM